MLVVYYALCVENRPSAWPSRTTPIYTVADLGFLKGGFQGSERVKDCYFT